MSHAPAVTAARLDEIRAALNDPSPRGFRAECRELGTACRQLLDRQELLTRPADVTMPPDGPLAGAVVGWLEYVARQTGSQLHADAARVINDLLSRVAAAEDAAKDAVDPERTAAVFTAIDAERVKAFNELSVKDCWKGSIHPLPAHCLLVLDLGSRLRVP